MNASNAFTSINAYGIWAAIIFVCLGLVAVFMAIVIYIQGLSAARRTARAATEVGTAVDRMEKFFDRLHADMSLLSKGLAGESQAHISEHDQTQDGGRGPGAVSARAGKAAILRQRLAIEIRQLMGAQGRTQDDTERILNDLDPVIARTIAQACDIEEEVSEEAIRSGIMDALGRSPDPIALGLPMGSVYEYLQGTLGEKVAQADVAAELYILRHEGRLVWNGHISALTPDTLIWRQ
jgi:hypothetical protein